MSENKPEPKDRTALYIAIVGASATIVAALIGVLPNIVNRNAPPPTPLVITTTPVPTQVSLVTSVPASASPPTPLPPTLTTAPTTVPPTLTTAPLTITREATLPAPTATAKPPATVSNIITFIVVNNLPQTMEFFVDGKAATKINSGTYQPLKVPRGTHELKQCILGTDYTDPNNCFAREYDIQPNPDVWVMFSDNNPLLTHANVSLLVLNRASIPQDIYIDGQLADTVAGGDFNVILVTPGEHTIQPCAPGIVPPNGGCGKAFTNRYSMPTHFFTIDGESS